MASRPKKQPPAAKVVPDFALWVHVSKSVDPVNRELAKELQQFNRGIIPMANPPIKPVARVENFKNAATPVSGPPSFEFTGLDRRQQQRLLRGKVEIDARLDLHGETMESARLKLLNFLSGSAAHGCRTVLVVTGKGSSQFTRHTLHGRGYHQSESRNGRLRNALPDWLHEAEFRLLVSGFQPAHPKHGGGGAVYIKLRNLARQARPR